jgi:hypothetical protein
MQCNVLTQLKHNGALYVPGSLADLPDDVAEGLIKDGVVEAYDPKATSGASTDSDTPTQTEEVKNAGDEQENTDEKNDSQSDNENEDSNSSEQPEGGSEQPLEDLPYQELQKRAASLEIQYVGVSRNDLIENIRAAEANSDENDGDNGDADEDDNGDDL